MTRRPSGDHTGSFSSQVSWVSRVTAPDLALISHKSDVPSCRPVTTSESDTGDHAA